MGDTGIRGSRSGAGSQAPKVTTTEADVLAKAHIQNTYTLTMQSETDTTCHGYVCGQW
jgi:hypothetical protein